MVEQASLAGDLPDPQFPRHRFALLGLTRAWYGPDEIQLGAFQQKAVLALLLLDADRPVPLPRLVSAIWPGPPKASSERMIRTYVYRLRRLLTGRKGTPSIIETVDDGYLIRVPDSALDLNVFRQHVAEAAAILPTDQRRAGRQLRQALQLWQGEALMGVPGEYAQLARDNLAKARLDALETALTIEVELRAGEVTSELAEVVGEHPLEERFRRLLMLALYRSGRQAESLQVYQETKTLLKAELGVDPEPRVHELYLRILHSDRELLAEPHDSATPVQIASPPTGSMAAPGHLPTDIPADLPADRPGFVGRVNDLARLDGLLADVGPDRAGPVIATVHGPAGIGKSALAVHWAHRVADRFPDGQIYLDLRGSAPSDAAMEPEQALRILLDRVSIGPPRVPWDREAQAAAYRTLLAGRRVLIVLDNARDAEQVRPLLPGAPGCLVIVTSRAPLTSLVALEHAFPLTLEPLGAGDRAAETQDSYRVK